MSDTQSESKVSENTQEENTQVEESDAKVEYDRALAEKVRVASLDIVARAAASGDKHQLAGAARLALAIEEIARKNDPNMSLSDNANFNECMAYVNKIRPPGY